VTIPILLMATLAAPPFPRFSCGEQLCNLSQYCEEREAADPLDELPVPGVIVESSCVPLPQACPKGGCACLKSAGVPLAWCAEGSRFAVTVHGPPVKAPEAHESTSAVNEGEGFACGEGSCNFDQLCVVRAGLFSCLSSAIVIDRDRCTPSLLDPWMVDCHATRFVHTSVRRVAMPDMGCFATGCPAGAVCNAGPLTGPPKAACCQPCKGGACDKPDPPKRRERPPSSCRCPVGTTCVIKTGGVQRRRGSNVRKQCVPCARGEECGGECILSLP
jgi:hypothetical protein